MHLGDIVLGIVLFEPSRLLADALAFALQDKGHTVRATTLWNDIPGMVSRLAPDLVVIADLLNLSDVTESPSVFDLARSVGSRVLVVAGEDQVESGDPPVGASIVGSGHRLSELLDAVEEAGRGIRVRDLDAPRADGATWGRALTPREREVLALLVCGATTSGIANKLGISTSTARTYVQKVLQKLGVHSRVEAVSQAHLVGARQPSALNGHKAP